MGEAEAIALHREDNFIEGDSFEAACNPPAFGCAEELSNFFAEVTGSPIFGTSKESLVSGHPKFI